MKMQISERAILARVTRRLAKDGVGLVKHRLAPGWNDYWASYFLVDKDDNEIIENFAGLPGAPPWRLPDIARQSGVLKAHEVVRSTNGEPTSACSGAATREAAA